MAWDNRDNCGLTARSAITAPTEKIREFMDQNWDDVFGGGISDIIYSEKFLDEKVRRIVVDILARDEEEREFARKVKSGKFVGKQKFTYKEFADAWESLRWKVEDFNDKCGEDEPDGYDIRNGYDTTEKRDSCANDWNMDFSLADIGHSLCRAVRILEGIPETITYGDLEVYWNDVSRNEADSTDHGIFIEDGKLRVY